MKRFKRLKLLTSLAAVAMILGATALSIFKNEKITPYAADEEETEYLSEEDKYSYIQDFKDFDFGLENFFLEDIIDGVAYSNPLYVPVSAGACKVTVFFDAVYRCPVSYVGHQGVFGYFDYDNFEVKKSCLYFNCRDTGDGKGVGCPAELNFFDKEGNRYRRVCPYVTIGDYCYFTVPNVWLEYGVYYSSLSTFTFTEMALNFERCFYLDSAVDYLTRIQEYGKSVQDKAYLKGSQYGRADGLEVGKKLGYDSGYDKAKNEWYAIGKKEGTDAGYRNGLNDGQEYNLQNLVWKILDAPFTLLNNIFDFELFGINLAKAIKVVISLLIVGIVVKALL